MRYLNASCSDIAAVPLFSLPSFLPSPIVINPDTCPLGAFETNYKLAASDRERSILTILRKNRGL